MDASDTPEMVAFIMSGINEFRRQATAGDPDFFSKQENIMVYREFASSLTIIYLNKNMINAATLATMGPKGLAN